MPKKNKKKDKIVIANSVGRDRAGNFFIHFPSRWTAKMGKAKEFSFYPYELAYLSSLLKRETDFSVKMVDGNQLGLNTYKYIDLISKEKPDWLVMETASPIYLEDLLVAKAIKKKFTTKLIFCGQHPTAFPKEVLKDGVDYVCLGEYEYTVLDILDGKKRKEILGLYPNRMRPPLDVNSLPFPEDKDISRFDYTSIGGCDYKEIEFFASRGCPHGCTFCVCGNLYYERPNWRPRKIKNIIDEIKYLRNKYPEMEGIFFDEEDHVLSKNFILLLCQAIVDHKLNDLKYNAMCSYMPLNNEILETMKKAGYYKLRIGIETASDKVAKEALRKPIDVNKLKKVLKKAKKLGILMYGTFTFGAPGSDEIEDRKTLKLIKELLEENLLYDYQRSICTPLPGTPFYHWAKNLGYLKSQDWDDYNGGTVVVEYPHYPPERLYKVYQEAGEIFFDWQVKKKGYFGLLSYGIQKYGFLPALRKGSEILYDRYFKAR